MPEPVAETGLAVTVVIPTRNEAPNVRPLLERLAPALPAGDAEILFVDDSDDDTPEVIAGLGDHAGVPVRLIHREPGKRAAGLSGAVLAGLRRARGRWVVVMDGDLQHPPELAPKLAEVGAAREVDLVIASRYVGSGDSHGLSSASRHVVSGAATVAAKLVFPVRLGRPSDPMTGFFAVRRDAIDPYGMQPIGFKILMEILVRHPRLRLAEVPFSMAPREAGQSKGTLREGLRFARHLLRLRTGLLGRQVAHSVTSSPLDWVGRAFAFGMVGLTGLVVNTAVLWLLTSQVLHLHYAWAAVLATEASTAWLLVLTETVLYRKGKPGGAVSRGARFFLLNHVALLARLPILALLVEAFGIGVLVANAITLVLLFLVRFVIADSALYGRGQTESVDQLPAPEPMRVVVDFSSAPKAEMNGHAPGDETPTLARYLPHRYSIAGVATIGSQVPLPELEYFRAQWIGNDPDIQVRVGRVGAQRPIPRAVFTQLTKANALVYREHLGRFGANFSVELGDRIEVVVSPSLSHSPHVVYTNILEALLRFVAVSRGTMLLHSACVELDGVGMLISARTDTGKTGTVLRLVREQGAKFLSDDMTVLHPDGSVGCYPKPLTISHHTLRALQSRELSPREWRRLRLQSRLHSKEGREFALVLARLNLPIMGVNALTQRIVPPPKYAVDRLLPCEIIPKTQVSELFVIERGPAEERALDTDAMMATLLANTEDAYQFPPFRQLAPSVVLGGEDHDALRRREREILASALERFRGRALGSPDFGWADEITRLAGESPVMTGIGRIA